MAQQATAKPSDDFAEAAMLAQQGRVAEAKTATLEALEHHPSSVEGYNLLGIIETNQQDYAGALEAFKKALKIAPNSVKTYNNIGKAYVAMKDLDSAEKAFRMGSASGSGEPGRQLRPRRSAHDGGQRGRGHTSFSESAGAESCRTLQPDSRLLRKQAS